MYTVKIFARNKEHTIEFRSEGEAICYAVLHWHLAPVVKDPFGNSVVLPGSCEDSEY